MLIGELAVWETEMAHGLHVLCLVIGQLGGCAGAKEISEAKPRAAMMRYVSLSFSSILNGEKVYTAIFMPGAAE
jgi:hypothetical protein